MENGRKLLDVPMREWPNTVLGRLPIVRAGLADSAGGFIRAALAARGKNERPFYSTSANGQVIALYGQDSAFRELMDQADQIHADGMPMVRYSKMFSKHPVTERVATTDLVHAVAELAVKAGVRFYFLGASEDVNIRAVEQMKKLHPGLVFAGRRNGYFSRDEEDAIVADIVASKADILWIGLGVPLEQAFVSRNIEKLHGVGIIKTSGGLFDFLSGRNKRAPGWMQAVGLEWAYRMYLEPRRLGFRYLATNPVALHALFRHSS